VSLEPILLLVVREFNVRATAFAKKLRLSQPAVSISVKKREASSVPQKERDFNC